MTIFNCLNSHEYFLCMSVTETSLPEFRNLLIFSVKTELSWFSKETIPWSSCVCQSSSKISVLFVLVLCLLVTLVSFAAVIRVVTQCSSPTNSLELCIPFPLSLRTNNMHVTVGSCTNHISRNICRQRSRFPRNGSLLLIGQFKERNEELELAAVSWWGTLHDDPNNGCEGDYSHAWLPPEYVWIFNACSTRNVEPAGRVYFPLPDSSRKIERDSARWVIFCQIYYWTDARQYGIYLFYTIKTGADLGGGGGGRPPQPPISVRQRFFFFLLKYTIILSFCKQAVGTFDFFS